MGFLLAFLGYSPNCAPILSGTTRRYKSESWWQGVGYSANWALQTLCSKWHSSPVFLTNTEAARIGAGSAAMGIRLVKKNTAVHFIKMESKYYIESRTGKLPVFRKEA